MPMPQFKFNSFFTRLLYFDENFEIFTATRWLQVKSEKLKTSTITSNGDYSGTDLSGQTQWVQIVELSFP